MDWQQTVEEDIRAMGALMASVVPVKEVQFLAEFRDACRANSCGKYGRCWMCPPDVGEIDEMIDRAKQYQWAVVFQTVGQLEDSFDIEGMQDAAVAHNQLTQQVAAAWQPRLQNTLVLGAGGCQLCETCAKIDGEPCRFPDKAISSLEAYGISVQQLASLAGMKYINGTNTVTYFSCLLCDGVIDNG